MFGLNMIMILIQTDLLRNRSTYKFQLHQFGASPNATFVGTYNDFANSGLKGKVSVWIECYDLAGNPVDGGGPGFDNDYVTYVSMDLEYPTIKSLNIEDSLWC